MNKRLLILSGIAMLAVVANHASHLGFVALFWWTDRYLPVAVPNYDQMGSLAYYGLIAQQKLALFSVPSFLFVSGVFIAYAARGAQSRLGWGMIWKRITNLLPPYIIWVAVYFLTNTFIGGQTYSAQDILLGVFTIAKSPYFFVPLLIVLFALSPFLAPLAKNHWGWLLSGLAVIEILAITRAYLRLMGIQNTATDVLGFIFSNQVAEFIFFYGLGVIGGFRLPTLKQALYKFRWPLAASTILFAILAVGEAEWIFRQYDTEAWRSATLSVPTFLYALSFILCFLAFDHVELPFSGFFYIVGVSTLAIYLMHKSILIVLPKVVYHVTPFILGHEWLYQPVLIGVSVGIPILLTELTKRTPFRKYYRVLYG